MVSNTGRTTDTRRIRRLKSPQDIEVVVSETGEPERVRLGAVWVDVRLMRRPWSIEQHWWRGAELRRMYYQLEPEDAPPLTIYRDLETGEWSRQRYQ